MGRLRVQHCILNAVTRQYGPGPTSDLLGVNYVRVVPADTEFPRVVPNFEVFVRFFATNLRRGRVLFTITLLEPAASRPRPVYRFRTSLPNFGGGGTVCYDRSFKFQNVSLPAEGLYCIRVLWRVRRHWDTSSGYRLLATEYFNLVRAS
jgi:hypothetical protein